MAKLSRLSYLMFLFGKPPDILLTPHRLNDPAHQKMVKSAPCCLPAQGITHPMMVGGDTGCLLSPRNYYNQNDQISLSYVSIFVKFCWVNYMPSPHTSIIFYYKQRTVIWVGWGGGPGPFKNFKSPPPIMKTMQPALMYSARNLEKTIRFSLKSRPYERFHWPEMS